MRQDKPFIIVRGGGDVATGTIDALHRAGCAVLILETTYPSSIRRCVSLSEAVYDGSAHVEATTCVYVKTLEHAEQCIKRNEVPLLIDPQGEILTSVRPRALIDAILAKRNLGTHRAMADHTIALGPGFEAGVDVDLVIETMRGHNLGRIITHGTALPNTGIPGLIAGHAQDRVVHASRAGIIHLHAKIGDIVQKHARLASIHDASGSYPVTAPIAGIVRGLIRNEFDVFQGMKIADVDPRIKEQGNCFTISDKARCIGGSALTALLQLNTQLPLLKAHQQD